MGSQVADFADAQHKVHIEIQEEDGDGEWRSTKDFEYKAGKTTTLKARLKVPEELEDMSPPQYVMETSAGAKLDPPFCEGRRSTGDGMNIVTVEIDGTEDRIELWAGWARGYEQVKLTKTSLLYKAGVAREEEEEEEDEDYEDSEDEGEEDLEDDDEVWGDEEDSDDEDEEEL